MTLVEQKIGSPTQRQEIRYLLEEDCGPRIQELLENNEFSLDNYENPITQEVVSVHR